MRSRNTQTTNRVAGVRPVLRGADLAGLHRAAERLGSTCGFRGISSPKVDKLFRKFTFDGPKKLF